MVTRREFLDTLAVGAAGLAIASTAKSYGQILGSNDRLNFAVIGLNGRAYAHLSALTITDHEACQVLQKGQVVVRRFLLPGLKIKWIDRLFTVERHGDHLAAHERHWMVVAVAPFDNRHLNILARARQQHLANVHALACARSCGDDRVGILKVRIKGRKWQQLSVRCFEQHQRRFGSSSPGQLDR